MPFVDVVIALILTVVVAWFLSTRTGLPEGTRGMLNVVLMLIVVGVALYLINTYVPMAGAIKTLLNVVVFFGALVAVLKAFGLWSGIERLWNNLRHHDFNKPQRMKL
jgi:hypothetical protein